MRYRYVHLLMGLCLGSAASVQAQPDWSQPAPGTFSSSMTVIATVAFDGVTSDDANDRVAAFVGSEVRGVTNVQVLGGTGFAFLTVESSIEGETITFQAYDSTADAERGLCTNLTFDTNATRGSLDDPLSFTTADGASEGTCPLHWQVVPGYGQSMTVNAALFIEGVRSSDAADRVAAFIGAEVRGVGTAFDVDGNQVFNISVSSETALETITFQGYDASTGTTYAISETSTFGAGSTVGSGASPQSLHTESVLPVELASFKALVDGSDVLLQWVTLSEENNAGFSIEQTQQGGWATIGFIDGAGTTVEAHHYVYRIPDLTPGYYRFRLRQQDYDGTVSYSANVEVRIDLSSAFELSAVYPNPFHDQATVSVHLGQRKMVRLAVYDMLGREVALLHEGWLTEQQRHSFNLQGQVLSRGAYLIRLEGEQVYATRRVLVLR